MKRIWKWFIRVGIILLILVILLAGVAIWFVSRPWSKASGTIQVSGLLSEVEVIRDKWGVPQIYAQNEHDLLFTQGYIHARDRLWQMEMGRRIGSGTLSEVVGMPGLRTDIHMRTIAIRREAEQAWEKFNRDEQTILEAYCDGVNAYISTHQDRLPLEFTLLNFKPEPWTPLDSLALGNMVAVYGSHDFYFELIRTHLVAKLGEEVLQHYTTPQIEGTPLIIPSEMQEYNGLSNYNPGENNFEMDPWLESLSVKFASNCWVLHGSRTNTGMPILANDPHTSLGMYLQFYEIGLHGGRFNNYGFTLPGIPFVVIGHNQHIAWGFAILNADMQDGYIERLDDIENPKYYEYMGTWHELDIITETINVKGRNPETVDVLWSRHGPIVSDIWGPLAKAAEPIALRWSFHEESLIFRSILMLNLAENWDEFRTALQYWDANGFDFVYADVKGNIGYQAAGRIPIRTPKHQGILLVPGWTDEYEWQGFIPFDELPSILNPPGGMIVAANNKVVSDSYPYSLSYFYAPGIRAKRITELLSVDKLLSVEDMQAIHRDVYSTVAEIMRPYLLSISPENDFQAKVLDYVKAWDLCFELKSVGASIYETWFEFLMVNTLGDEYGQERVERSHYTELCYHVFTMTRLMPIADSHWFDDADTPGVETRDDIIRRSFVNAVDWLREKYGKNPQKWTWGRLHTWTPIHEPLGQSGIDLLEFLFNGRKISIPGGYFTANSSAYVPSNRFNVIYGVSLRMIIDLSNWDNTLTVNRGGQSGHLFHPHQKDQYALWQKVEHHPAPFSRERVTMNAKAILTLTPQQ